MNFGEKLKALREKNNLTQAVVAKELGVTQRAISYYENNNVIPNDPNALNKLANLFGITLDELLLKNQGPKSKWHLLVEKLIEDTKNKRLSWDSFETAFYYDSINNSNLGDNRYYHDDFNTDDFPQYKNFTFVNKESFFASYKGGGYLVEKLLSPEKEIDIALFVLYDNKFSYIANKDSINQIEELYIILSNITPGVTTFIDEYLKDDLEKDDETEIKTINTDDEIPF
ncbi:MAG: helix-turn-helix domain-containing protein [Megasphaera cerevisiae]|jgi:transcriptional regulator with XRE-family HTH domain|nr:helix-turn-helix domain-containing protein [Megasphaera cerevisiae]